MVWFPGMVIGQSNSVIQINPGLSLVAMTTKFGTKWATARLLLKISARSMRLQEGGGSELGHRMPQMKFCCDPSWLPWQRNLRQNEL